MTTTQTLKRTAGLVGALTATSGLALASAAQAAPTSYNTGWQCISPFISTFGNVTGGEDVTPDGFLDSLDIQLSRTGNPLVAAAGQPLYLDGANLSLEFTHPDPLKNLWRRTGGVTISYTGVPGWANVAGVPNWTDASLGSPSSATSDHTTEQSMTVRVKEDGLSYWSYAVGPRGAQEIHYAPEPISATPLTGTSNLPQPKVDPTATAPLTVSAGLGHAYLGNRNNNNYPITSYVTIEGTNTVEKYQTVRVDGYWTVNVKDPTPGSATDPAGYANGDETVTAPRRTFAVPSSKWTPTGTGPVEFRIAPPGHSAPIEIESKGYDRDGYNRPIRVKPFGSVYVRAETKSYASSNDCVRGGISIADSTISDSGAAGFIGNASPTAGAPDLLGLGDLDFPGFLLANSGGGKNAITGAAGRFALTQPTQPAFATAPLPTPLTPPTVTPVTTAAPVALTAEVLGVRKKKTTINVTNNTTTETQYSVSVTTKSKYKSGKKKKKLSVIVPTTTTVKPGASSPVKVTVKKAVRALLKKRSVVVHVKVTPKHGKTKTYSVTLTQL